MTIPNHNLKTGICPKADVSVYWPGGRGSHSQGDQMSVKVNHPKGSMFSSLSQNPAAETWSRHLLLLIGKLCPNLCISPAGLNLSTCQRLCNYECERGETLLPSGHGDNADVLLSRCNVHHLSLMCCSVSVSIKYSSGHVVIVLGEFII